MAQQTYRYIQELLQSLPNLDTRDMRRALLTNARLDEEFAGQVNCELPPMLFIPHLIDCAKRYSTEFSTQHPMIQLLEAAKGFVGKEKQTLCDEFIRQLCDGVYTDEQYERPKRPWNVPYQRNPYFTGRAQELQQLHEALHRDRCAALSQTQAISGLGGIGKTQTAVEYAFRHAEEYSAVLWVLADSNEALFSGFAALARELGLPEQHAQEQEKAVKAVLRWLSTHSGWLLIFDNADDPALLKPYLPPQAQGHILITSRARVLSAAGVTQPLALPKLPPDDARQFLLERAGRELTPQPPLFGKERGNDGPIPRPPLLEREGEQRLNSPPGRGRGGFLTESRSSDSATHPQPLPGGEFSEESALTEIVQKLDGLPLALEQAGAYLHETQCSFNDYLAGYRKRKLQLLERHAPEVGTHPQSVAATWMLNFEQVQQASAAAADILRLSAFLYPDDIPEELLTDGAANVLESLKMLANDPLTFNETLVPLTRFHLISRELERHTYSIHRIVQAALQATLPKDEQPQWAERAVNVVSAAFPDVKFEVWSICERLLPQALRCAELIIQWQILTETAGRLLNQSTYYLNDRARYDEAEPLLQRGLQITEETYGPSHSNMATSLNNLAELYRAQGRYAEAESLYQRSLRIWETALGAESPDVAIGLNNLAELYRIQGRYAEAESLYQRSLWIRETVLGPKDLDVANSLNNLALLYQEQGRLTEAAPLLQHSLRITETMLGPEHPYVAASLNNLAMLYDMQRHYAKAESLYQRSLKIKTSILGPEHPDVAASLNNLAELYRAQGRYIEAEPLYQRSLCIWEMVLGSDHPDVATSLNNFALLYQAQGRYVEAEALLQRSLRIRETALGSEHPHVAGTLNNLAALYWTQGRYANAEPLYQRSLRIWEQTLGEIHPHVLTILVNYTTLLRKLGRDAEAEPLEARAAAIRAQLAQREE